MKNSLERFLFGLILAPLAPLAGLLAAWWAGVAWLPEKWVPLAALAGLCAGIIVDIFILKRLVDRARQMNTLFWAIIFLFYTVGIFGFFMGVPVFNALLAIPAGFVAAVKLRDHTGSTAGIGRAARKAAWFTTAGLFLVCAASALIALASSSTPSDLKGMLGLGFEVTRGMILALILVGGTALLAFNWILTWVSTRLADRFLLQKGIESGLKSALP
jgi:hypothetical protein